MENCPKCRSSSVCSEHRQSGIRVGIEEIEALIGGTADTSGPAHKTTSSITTPGLVMVAYPPVRVVSDCSMQISRSDGVQNVIVTSPSTYGLTAVPGMPAPTAIAQDRDGARNVTASPTTTSGITAVSDTPAPAAFAQPMTASLAAPGQDGWLGALRNSSMAMITTRSGETTYPPISSVCTSRGCMTLTPKRLTVQSGNSYITVKPSTPLGSLPTDSSVVFLEQSGLPINATSKTNFIVPSAPEAYAIARVSSSATSSTVVVKGDAALVTPKTKSCNDSSGKTSKSDAKATSNSLTRTASDPSPSVDGNADASKRSSLTRKASTELRSSMSAPSVERHE